MTQSRVRSGLTGLCLLGIALGYAFFFSRITIANHHALNTHIADLGYYDNIFYQSLHRRPLACSFIKGGVHFSSHFDPILVLLSPIYRIYSHAETLLVLQALWLSSAVVPLYLYAARRLKSRAAGISLALCFVFYPALHGVNAYEFHSLALIVPLVLWLLYFLETSATKRYFATLVLLLLCREDVALLMCFVGFYGILQRRRDGALVGTLTIVLSLVYFGCVKLLIMRSPDLLNSGSESTSFAYYYADLIPNKNGVLGLVSSILTNPVFVLRTVLDESKLLFFAQLFVPLLFLPLLARGRVMLLYGLTFCLLATRSAVYSIHFQYSSVLFPIAFWLVPKALSEIEDRPWFSMACANPRQTVRAAIGGMMIMAPLMAWKFGALLPNESFRGGFTNLVRTLTPEQKDTYAWVRQTARQIPEASSVAASTRLGPHISSRKDAYFYPHPRESTDYIFVDESELKGDEVSQLKKQAASGKLAEVARRARIVLYQTK